MGWPYTYPAPESTHVLTLLATLPLPTRLPPTYFPRVNMPTCRPDGFQQDRLWDKTNESLSLDPLGGQCRCVPLFSYLGWRHVDKTLINRLIHGLDRVHGTRRRGRGLLDNYGWGGCRCHASDATLHVQLEAPHLCIQEQGSLVHTMCAGRTLVCKLPIGGPCDVWCLQQDTKALLLSLPGVLSRPRCCSPVSEGSAQPSEKGEDERNYAGISEKALQPRGPIACKLQRWRYLSRRRLWVVSWLLKLLAGRGGCWLGWVQQLHLIPCPAVQGDFTSTGLALGQTNGNSRLALGSRPAER